MAKKKESLSFEAALAELEDIVTAMEQGDLNLEDSLSAFERGINLTRQCQTSIKDAEQKVSILVEKMGNEHLEAFDAETSKDD